MKLSSGLAERGLSGPSSLPPFTPAAGRARCLTGLVRGLFGFDIRPDAAEPFRPEAAESGRDCEARLRAFACFGGLGLGLRGGVSTLSR